MRSHGPGIEHGVLENSDTVQTSDVRSAIYSRPFTGLDSSSPAAESSDSEMTDTMEDEGGVPLGPYLNVDEDGGIDNITQDLVNRTSIRAVGNSNPGSNEDDEESDNEMSTYIEADTSCYDEDDDDGDDMQPTQNEESQDMPDLSDVDYNEFYGGFDYYMAQPTETAAPVHDHQSQLSDDEETNIMDMNIAVGDGGDSISASLGYGASKNHLSLSFRKSTSSLTCIP